MHLRDWPPRKIGLMWLAGCAAEALIILVLWVIGNPPPAEYPDERRAHADSVFAADTVPTLDLQEAARQLGVTTTREPVAGGDTLVRIQRDSSFVVARVAGDTIRVVNASPDVQKAVTNLTGIMVRMFEGLERLLLILAALLLPIPILLVLVTGAWTVLRMRGPRVRTLPSSAR